MSRQSSLSSISRYYSKIEPMEFYARITPTRRRQRLISIVERIFVSYVLQMYNLYVFCAPPPLRPV